MPEPHHTCETCHETIVSGTPGVVEAVTRIDVSTFGQPEMADGIGVLFHEECYPHGSRAYRLV